MKNNVPLYSFNAGEVSKQALARVDVAKLRLAAACQLNWMPWVIGSMMLRPGLQFIGEVLGDAKCKLLPFVFSKLDTALIELTPNQMRVWVNDQLVTRPAVSTTISDPTFVGGGTWSTANSTAGAVVAIAGGSLSLGCKPLGGLAQAMQTITVAAGDIGKEHGIRFVVVNGPVTVRCGTTQGAVDLIARTEIDTGTHCLTCTPTTTTMWLQIESTDARFKLLTSVTIDPAGALVIATPWGAGDLDNVRIDSSGDVIFVGCYGQQQHKIERRGLHAWSTVLYRSNDGPFQAGPAIDAHFQVSAMTGNAVMTSSRPYFQPQHVGCLFRLFTPGQQNQTDLGGNATFSEAVRVTGVGNAMRDYTWLLSGTWVGTVTLQRSLDGPDSGFRDVSSTTVNGNPASLTGSGGAPNPNLDNVIAWERLGFKDAALASGFANVVSGYTGGGGYGICRVTAFTNQSTVNVEILEPFSSVQPTSDWVEAEWSGVSGWPTAPQFHEGRLGWVGGDRQWFSASDAFTSYGEIDRFGNPIGDAGPISLAFGSGPVDTVSWGLSLTRFLAGREQSISSTRSSNFDQPLTPTSIVVRDCSDQGAQRLPAVKVGKRGIFVQQSGRRVYELAYSPQEMDYDERDLTRLNNEIGIPGFVDIAVSYQPDKMIWLPRGDGQVAALLYDVKDQVEAWWRLQTLGVIENVCVLPSGGLEDRVYFVVRRNIVGVTHRFIEKLARRDQAVGGLVNIQADCALVYNGPAVSTIAVPWLPFSQVVVWADGVSLGTVATDGAGNCPMPDGLTHGNIIVGLGGAVVSNSSPSGINVVAAGIQYAGYPCEVFADIGLNGKAPLRVGTFTVDTSGNISLPPIEAASTIVAFLGYVAPFQSAKLAYAAQMGSALTQKKKIDQVGLVMFDTYGTGIKYGQRFDQLDDLPALEADTGVAPGTIWPQYDEPMISLAGEWNTDARLCLLAQAPNPCTIGCVVVGMQSDG